MPMVRERPSLAPRQFIEITPALRRALEALVEAGIAALDEIDAPTEDLEEDDPEEDADADEDGHDLEREADVDDSTLTLADTGRGYGLAATILDQGEDAMRMRESFDPRLTRRPPPGCTIPYVLRRLPTFPHEPADRLPFDPAAEKRRLRQALGQRRRRRW